MTDDPDELRVKFEMARRIALEIEDRDLGHAAVAEMTGLEQVDVSRICDGMVRSYSVWLLMRLLAALGSDIAIEVVPSGDTAGKIYVVDEEKTDE